jgi:hypothetical protein
MNVTVKSITVNIDPRQIDRKPVHEAMAKAYLKLVQGTFGPSGLNRESEWPALSPRYKKRLEREKNPFGGRFLVPTLYRSGALFRHIGMSANSDSGTVFSRGLPYSAIHQWGNPSRNLPRRPFFPFDSSGNPTPQAVQVVTDAAMKAVKFK